MTKTMVMDDDVRVTVLRDLGAVERLFHLVSKRANTHFCIVGEVRGSLDPTQVRTAFERVRCRHPLISACIDKGPSGAPAAYRSDLPVEVRFPAAAPSDDWTAMVAREMARPFSDAYGPLLRATVLQGRHKASIVLTCHHCLADGRSGVRVLSDLLDQLAGGRLKRTGVPASLDRFADEAIGSAPVRATQPRGPASRPPADIGSLAPSDTTPRVSTIALSRSETSRLLRASRNAMATLHGAICVALAATSVRRRSAETFGIASWMDHRAVVSAPRDVCALIGSAAPTWIGNERLADGPRSDFWAKAAKVSRNLAAARRPEVLREELAALQSAVPRDADVDTAMAAMHDALDADVFVANLGPLTIERTFGALTLDAVWGPVIWPARFKVPVFGVTGFDGALHIVQTGAADDPPVLEELKDKLLGAIDRETPG